MAEEMYPKPSVSRNVHLNDSGRCLAAMITNVHPDSTVDLVVFPPMAHAAVVDHVVFGDSDYEGRWHWPERV